MFPSKALESAATRLIVTLEGQFCTYNFMVSSRPNIPSWNPNEQGLSLPRTVQKGPGELRDPAAILCILRNTCSDSIAELFRACFWWGIAQLSRDILLKMGYRTDVLCKLSTKEGYRTILGAANLPEKGIVRYGVSQR